MCVAMLRDHDHRYSDSIHVRRSFVGGYEETGRDIRRFRTT